MDKFNFLLVIVWSFITIYLFNNSFEKLYEERVNNLIQSPVLSKEECSQYVGGLVGKSENSKISNVKVSGNIKLPLGCKNSFAGGIVGQDSGSVMDGLESDVKIEYYDPNQTKTNFFKTHLVPIAQSVIASFVFFFNKLCIQKV
ncbi:GLUG motif-containing protein [Lysinibacillus boronitolerans]|uniref:GLUG motif-containing protein n=1 Tax=Lysinibacillus boronitolerans TaxID=309788 RepID=UPI00035F8E62|nr:GLUG motif-containing protein [Lysinibacillus boronitolerans]